MINLQQIEEANASGKPVYIKNGHSFRTNWDEYVQFLYRARSEIEIFCQCNSYIHKNSAFVGHDEDGRNILLYNKFDPVVFGSNDIFEPSAQIENFVKENLGMSGAIKIIANLAGYENPSGIHPDDRHVMSFQLTGRCQYRIFYNVPESHESRISEKGLEYETYDLEPGDAIYMPKGLEHQVVIFEPRITAIVDFDKDR